MGPYWKPASPSGWSKRALNWMTRGEDSNYHERREKGKWGEMSWFLDSVPGAAVKAAWLDYGFSQGNSQLEVFVEEEPKMLGCRAGTVLLVQV